MLNAQIKCISTNLNSSFQLCILKLHCGIFLGVFPIQLASAHPHLNGKDPTHLHEVAILR